MLKLKIGDKELQVKFGYEVTLKTRLLSRVAKREVKNENSENTEIENMEDVLMFIPEILLVGLQKFHKEEYGYDYESEEEEEKAKQIDEMYALIDAYCDEEENDAITLYKELQKELLEDGFLASMFRKEKAKAEQNAQKKNQKEKN